MSQTWELWYPDAAAAGLSFARARVDPKDVDGRLLVHAAPARLDVVVRDETGAEVARGDRLERREKGPMSVLQWWHADDHSEWRWQVEFFNHV